MNAEKLIANSLGTLIAVAALGASAQLSISLPESVSVAPITGQSLAILLIAHLLKWQWGSLAFLLYVLIGALGVPVFSNFSSGTEVLFGPTLGYFIGFGLSILVVGRLAEIQASKFGAYFLQMFTGSLLILLCGWLGLFRFLEPVVAFKKGILPFLPGALTKVLLGSIILSVVRRFKNVMSLDQS